MTLAAPRSTKNRRKFLNWAVIAGSALVCLLLLPMRLPGTELLGVRPNWLLIWVVAFSVKRTQLQGTIAGLALGLILDGMTASHPSHAVSLGIVGWLTARLYKLRFFQEDLISIAIVVFGMTLLYEAITALQHSLHGLRSLESIWETQHKAALCCAILSSLWAPVAYYPLHRWWRRLRALEQV
ncbi:MAG: rod shape-determining protein MreD [Cyanobacteriota bacterium]|nr:rod shape-determining protein MreD [Cyanobacteriota bacterium]